jgi:hypothetical protein
MRFPQVAIGQLFTYQGKHYTKTGPLTASEEGGDTQRMIPRAAEVTLIDAAGSPVQELKQRYNRSEVNALLQRFKADLVGRLEEMAARDGTLDLEQVVGLIRNYEAWSDESSNRPSSQ